MADDFDKSIGDEATLAGKAKRRPLSEGVSLGDERTLGDGRSEQDTLIDDIEIVDLEARYRVEGTLGKGGMGAVLLATDTRLDRKVAIKRILGEAAGNRLAVQRFLTEAKAIAAINHPNIVQIYDYGRAEDGPFLIMEYVDGGSLLDRCRDGALPLDQAVDLACQLCDGLAKAHELGIVHRDIKPANVLLTKDGSPKLTDFGLAKADAADHQMTITGAVLGTPDFMPPEQRRDAALVDHRSDLWSLAATFYQMVTGRSPKIIRFNDIPAALQEVLAKALEDTKEARYQSAREFRDSLRGTLAAADPGSTELDAGKCPACGVRNDSSRRFCRGCGGSLEAPCLSCERPMPMWEEICGQCGSKQTPLLSERRSEMAAQQAEAESLLKDYDFEHSERITIALRDEVDPRLKQCVPWATGFLDELGAAQELQKKKANEWLTEALKHEASYDYKAAAKVLEQVPLRLRAQTLLGRSESLAITLNRLMAKRDEASRLQTLIKRRIKSNELSGLLEDVERLRLLRPDRRDLEVLATQLTDRHSKLTALRDEAIDRAKALLIAKDWEKALAALKEVDPSVESPETERLRTDARTSLERLQAFLQEIRQAVANKQLDGLLSRVDAALELKPGHQDLVRLRENLLARERKIAAEIDALIAEGDNAIKACAFNKAKAALLRIPEWRRDGVTARLKTADHLGALRSAVMESMEWFAQAQDLTSAEPDLLLNAVRDCQTYLFAIADHQLKDPSVEEWHDRLEAATAKHQSSRKRSRWLRESFRQILAGTTAIGHDFREYIADLTDHLGIPQKIRHFAVTVFALILFGAAAWGVYYGCVGAWRIQNSIGMRLTYIPSGEYGRKIVRLVFDERNREKFIRSKVRIPSPFYIGCTEVTQGQWKAIVNTKPWHGQPNAIDRDTQPATYMSRASAEVFCKALTERERAAGRISQSQLYRLPTEVEWEYACASDSTATFYAGDSPETVSPYEWCAANSDGADGDHPRDVALKWPTKRGIYDAFGNVSEICTDFVRGACWTDPPDRCAISRNTNASPPDGNAQTGFRVLLESTR